MASTSTADPRRTNPRRLARRPKAAARRDGAGPAPGPRGSAPVPKRPARPGPPQGRRPEEQNEAPRARGKAPVSRAANENEPTNAALIGRLKRRPSSVPYWIAIVGSLVWVLVASFVIGRSGISIFNPLQLDNLAVAAAGILLPCALMFAIAGIYRRSQQMSYVSDALVQTALRLVRPEDVTTEGLSTVGQAVRREVSQLVGGVEHAVNRAGELEQLVHKELSALERVFGGNEERIHNLLQGLETQRGALEQAGKVYRKFQMYWHITTNMTYLSIRLFALTASFHATNCRIKNNVGMQNW